MKFISTLLKKFNKSSPKQKRSSSESSDSNKNIWKHDDSSEFAQKLKKYEARQKKIEEDKEVRQDRRTLRRQNRFLGFHNDLLVLQNQRLVAEKHNLKAERQEVTEKKNDIARRLRKQRRISEYYRRKIAEMQALPHISIDN